LVFTRISLLLERLISSPFFLGSFDGKEGREWIPGPFLFLWCERRHFSFPDAEGRASSTADKKILVSFFFFQGPRRSVPLLTGTGRPFPFPEDLPLGRGDVFFLSCLWGRGEEDPFFFFRTPSSFFFFRISPPFLLDFLCHWNPRGPTRLPPLFIISVPNGNRRSGVFFFFLFLFFFLGEGVEVLFFSLLFCLPFSF